MVNHVTSEREIHRLNDRYEIQKGRCMKNMYFLYKLTIQAFLRYLKYPEERKVVKEHSRDTTLKFYLVSLPMPFPVGRLFYSRE